MTCADLARLADTTRQAISQIELGKHKPSFDVVAGVIKGLGLTESEFYAYVPPSDRSRAKTSRPKRAS